MVGRAIVKKTILVIAGVLAISSATATPQANAAGCVRGAIVGGVTGHFVGHHGLLGAGVGCAIGHHEAIRHERERERMYDRYHRY